MAGRKRQLLFCSLALLAICGVARTSPTGTYLIFSEITDGAADFLEVAGTPDLDLSGGSFTLSAWIHPDGWGDGGAGRILDHGGDEALDAGWSVNLEHQPGAGILQSLRVQINGDATLVAVSDANSVTLGSWQHVAVTLEEQILTLYVDGAVVGVYGNIPTPIATALPMRAGSRAADVSGGFDGKIDEIRAWNRALSQQEVLANMNVELVGSEPGLIAYYRLDSGGGQAILDGSGRGHTAQLGSTPAIDANDPAWESSAGTNMPPVANAGADRTIVLPNNVTQLDGQISDDNFPGNLLSVTWSVGSGPGLVAFVDASAAITDASFDAAGSYVLRLSASDGQFVHEDTVVVTVDAAQVLSRLDVIPGTAGVPPGGARQYNALGFDQAGNQVVIVPAWSATGGTIDSDGLYVAGAVPGEYTVEATSDGISAAATVVLNPISDNWPTNGWTVATPAELNMDPVLLATARDYALTGGGSGMITRSGSQVMTWGDQLALYELRSTTKSIGATVLGLAIKDGLLSVDDNAQQHLAGIGLPPAENASTGWLADITLRHLATHTAGFDKPGGYIEQPYRAGTAWAYSDGGANWLADVLTVKYNTDLNELMFARIFGPLGIESTDITWRNHAYREQTLQGIARREFGSGMRANVDALARIGYLYLRSGEWDDQTLIPAAFVAQTSEVQPSVIGLPVDNPGAYGDASGHYGLLWWNNSDGALANVPADAFWSWGLHDSIILVIPSLDIVAVRAGGGWRQGWDGDYLVVEPFITPIAASASALGNQPPVVDSGVDVSVQLPVDTVSLDGTASDDGLPSGTLTTLWSVASGAGTVQFGDAAATDTDAVFSDTGTYVLQLSADDGELSSSDTLSITVESAPGDSPPQVTIVNPPSGATVTGQLQLSADVVDDFGIVSVRIAINGSELAVLEAPPYHLDWDSNILASGTHELAITATSISGMETTALATLYVDALPQQPSAYPASAVLTGLQWAPVGEISRAADGSDNWPLAWADDGELYVAYGDGWGFAPPVGQKLSLGYAKVSGPADGYVGENIPSPTGEALGHGPRGKKASGLLMIDGRLYQWVRNADGNGQGCELAWSDDRGASWKWSTWQFAEFGYCVFLDYGQNYQGARDSYVYSYSPDSPSAYNETDHLITMRVPIDRVLDRDAYEFFAGLDVSGNAMWSPDVSARQPVFSFAGGVNRVDVNYHPVHGRYLMTLRSRAQNGGRNQFSIYEGKEPWGPWSVVYYTENWDGSPVSQVFGGWGEAQRIPPKWMSANGRDFHLVFSGDDTFAVRRGTLTVEPDTSPPLVNFVTPLDDENVAGLVDVTVSVADDFAIQSTAFTLDGVQFVELFGFTDSFSWQTSGVSEGSHTLTATATDTSGNQSVDTIVVNVFQDLEAPLVMIDEPLNDSIVSGVVSVMASASDNVAVASVTFEVDSMMLGENTSAPYVVAWDTLAATNGDYVVTATATDTSGNSATSAVNVAVNNIIVN